MKKPFYFLVINMNHNIERYKDAPNPSYIIEEEKLRKNLELITSVAKETNIEIILAFKAFALWKTFPIFKEYIHFTTASSLYEAQMAFYKFGSKAYTYSPAYESKTFDNVLKCSKHITFNSLSQYNRFYPTIEKYNKANHSSVDVGIRINPQYSEVETELYDPSAKGSRFGVLETQLPERLPSGITSFHCHNLCESDSYAFEKTWEKVEEKFGKWLLQIKSINLGGGHLMTRKGYNIPHLISVIQKIKKSYPHLQIILEPGAAFVWQTGVLKAQVVDIVENSSIKTAILNVSFACHMPDCLEMPYQPSIVGAESLNNETIGTRYLEKGVYRLGGNSCLSGDFIGYWDFRHPLAIGDTIIFEDMIHYTTVKTNMFNGISHPSISMLTTKGVTNILKEYSFDDYLNRMD